MSDALKNAVVELMGFEADIEYKDLGDGRSSILLKQLPKPSNDNDPRFFKHSIEATWKIRASDDSKGNEAADEDGSGNSDGLGSVRGVASSTSVDFYGTEMSLDALKAMEAQLTSTRGVPLLPAHSNWFSTPEWDSVIGHSIAANIEKSKVSKPYDKGEQGYVLDSEFSLFGVDKAEELKRRIEADQEIGLSIGGWFTSLAVIYNEETDELERIIILDVHLDHVAATRMPANPDSVGLTTVRSAIKAMLLKSTNDEQSVQDDGDVRIGDINGLAKQVAELVSQSKRGTSGAGSASSSFDVGDPEVLDNVNDASEDNGKTCEGKRTTENEQSVSSSNTEPGMTEELIAEMLNKAANRAVEGVLPKIAETVNQSVRTSTDSLSARMTEIESKLEERSSSAGSDNNSGGSGGSESEGGDEESEEVKGLRAQVASLSNSVDRLSSAPVRRGRHGGHRSVPAAGHGPGAGAGSAFRSIIASCRGEEAATALSIIVERNIGVLAEEDGPSSVQGKGSVRSLENLLASGLRAAEADGLINRSSAVATWQ